MLCVAELDNIVVAERGKTGEDCRWVEQAVRLVKRIKGSNKVIRFFSEMQEKLIIKTVFFVLSVFILFCKGVEKLSKSKQKR